MRGRTLRLAPLGLALFLVTVGHVAAHPAVRRSMLCIKPPPPGSISITLGGSKGILGRFRLVGCGPKGSYASLTLTPRALDRYYHVVLRPGTCSSVSPGPWYTLGFEGLSRDSVRDWFANPAIPINTLVRTAFAVELVLPGATAASACGSHQGTQGLPGDQSGRIDSGYGIAKRVSRSRLILPIAGRGRSLVWAAVTPSKDDAQTLVVVHGQSLGSTPVHMRLRRGRCPGVRPALSREVPLQTFGIEVDGVQTTSTTTVHVPFASLAAGGWAIELFPSGTFETTPLACGQIDPP